MCIFFLFTIKVFIWRPPQELEAYPCRRLYLLISSILKIKWINCKYMCVFLGCSYFSGFLYSRWWPFLLCVFLHVLKLSLTHWLYLRISIITLDTMWSISILKKLSISDMTGPMPLIGKINRSKETCCFSILKSLMGGHPHMGKRRSKYAHQFLFSIPLMRIELVDKRKAALSFPFNICWPFFPGFYFVNYSPSLLLYCTVLYHCYWRLMHCTVLHHPYWRFLHYIILHHCYWRLMYSTVLQPCYWRLLHYTILHHWY